MNVKHTSYLATAIKASHNKAAHPKPYTYREQLSRGFAPLENPYEFNFRLAAYCDVNNINKAEFARRGQALSNRMGLGIRLTPSDLNNYIYCHCKPKSEKRYLIGQLIGAEEGWVTGYNHTLNKEAPVEEYIDSFDDAKTPPPDGGRVVKPSIAMLLKLAKQLEDNLKGA